MSQIKMLVDAYDDFIKGCKSDGIWSSMKAACIMAGWDNLDGALVPLVGSAPTNNNFVSGDYDRETGLVGASTKYLNSNRANNADPQDDQHIATFPTNIGTGGVFTGMSSGSAINGDSFLGRTTTRSQAVTSDSYSTSFSNNNLVAISRAGSSAYTQRSGGVSSSISRASTTPSSNGIYVFGWPTINSYSNARLSFYSIGESLDLADLDSRVSTLMTDIAAAIP